MKKIFVVLTLILGSYTALAQNECPTVNPITQPYPAFNVIDSSGVRHQNGCFDNTSGRMSFPNLGPLAITIANASSTGTTNFTVTKLTGAPSTAVIAATTDNKNSAVVGITVNNAGTTGNATIAFTGIVPCIFDNNTTAGDFVTVSTGTAGDCHDSGSTIPVDGSVILGRVLTTVGSNPSTTNIEMGAGLFNSSLGAPTSVTSGTQSCGTAAAGSAANCSGNNTNISATFKEVIGTTAFSSGTPSAVTLTNLPAFTGTNTFICTCTAIGNTAAIAAGGCAVTNVSATSVTFTGPNTVTTPIAYDCKGT